MNISVIVFAGMIGVGKTTYSKKLSDELGTKVFFESVDDNPILDLYYSDQERYAFALQIHFLNTRFQSIKKAFDDNNNVLDRSIYEDELFTYVNYLNGNITKEEYNIYTSLLENMMEELDGLPKKAPDLLIYLKAPFEHIIDNISKRGRVFEQAEKGSTLYNYYKQLHSEYDNWFNLYNKSPKVAINVEEFDVLRNSQDWEKVFNVIKSNLLE